MEVNGSSDHGRILNGKEISSEVKNAIKEEITDIRKQHPTFTPGLAIVQVGDRQDSNVYVGMKIKTGNELGLDARHVKLPQSITQENLINEITKLNNDASIHGIIVQLPLDCTENIDTSTCTTAVLPSKDVDGLHDVNAGRLSRGDLDKCFIPCTPRGCLKLIKETGIDIKGKQAVVIGRSRIVGVPMANLLTWSHATVTICHSRTENLADVVKRADILVVACGKKELVKHTWVKKGAIVIDCGINVVPDSTKKSGRRLVGDVEFQETKSIASWITPVPGGVGPMTVSMLMRNTLESAKQHCLNSADEKSPI